MRRQEGTEKKTRRKSKAVHFGSKCKLKLNTSFRLHRIELNSFCCFVSRKRRSEGNRKERRRKSEGNEKEMRTESKGNRQETRRKQRGQRR